MNRLSIYNFRPSSGIRCMTTCRSNCPAFQICERPVAIDTRLRLAAKIDQTTGGQTVDQMLDFDALSDVNKMRLQNYLDETIIELWELRRSHDNETVHQFMYYDNDNTDNPRNN